MFSLAHPNILSIILSFHEQKNIVYANNLLKIRVGTLLFHAWKSKVPAIDIKIDSR
jgi:hypothetical protein